MILRLLKILVLTALGLVAATVAAYVVLIHPNDTRMDLSQNAATAEIQQFYTRRGTLFVNHMAHRLDLSSEAFVKRRQDMMAALPDYVLPSSKRFVSPYQIYVPVGSYPLKLDAQDGVFIPSGATLTVEPGIAGAVEVRFAAFSPKSAATLVYDVAGQGTPASPVSLPLTAPPDPKFDANAHSYRNVWRFLSPDQQDRLESWQEARRATTLAPGAKLTFKCEGGAFGCILGDVGFYEKAEKPAHNVLVMLVDTLRSDAVHAGNAPVMQALADDSVDFTHALAPGNMTSPSTNSFLSCRRASQLGELAFAYTVTNEYREDYYASRQLSFPARFLQSGYDTAMIGNVSVISEIYGVGVNHGFARQVSLETDGYDTPAIAREAVKWLAANGDHQFLLYLHFNGPHAPYRAPFKDIFSTYPGLSGFSSYSKALLWLYQSEVAYTDRYVAKVLTALKALGLSDTTTVVLTADHGDQHRFHDFTGNHAAPDFSGAYFDHGATLLNDEVHVPLVIHQPQGPVKRVDDYVSTLDLGPTLLELTGAGSSEGCAGASLVPYIAGAPTDPLRHRVLGSEGFRGRAIVFDDQYKYIRTYEPTDKRVYTPDGWSGALHLYMAPEQLFDLTADPDETHDLAGTDAGLLAKARGLYRSLYEIGDAYELVVESPDSAPFTATLPPGAKVRFEEGEGKVETDAAGVHLSAGGRRRYLVEVHDLAGAPSALKVGDKAVRLAMTSMRLPLGVEPAALPAEAGGRYTLLDAGKLPAAYLRKVEDDGQKNRRIMTGNPAFEKVLREWGYLNDK